jgi:hypothetical protein
MQTQCISDQLDFEAFDGRRVVAGVDGGLRWSHFVGQLGGEVKVYSGC